MPRMTLAQVRQVRRPEGRCAEALVLVRQGDDAIRVGDAHGTQDRGIDNPEHRDGRADTECERGDDDDAEEGLAHERPASDAQVHQGLGEHGITSGRGITGNGTARHAKTRHAAGEPDRDEVGDACHRAGYERRTTVCRRARSHRARKSAVMSAP